MMPSEQRTQRAALAAGQRLGHFQIISILGIGGMGEVYRAHDTRLNRDVAIKTLPQHLAQDPDWLARLQREARIVSSLNHPNVICVYDVGQHETTSFMVSELVEGQSLRQVITSGPLPLPRVIDLATQIADGLAAAHAVGLVHRDLKPENVMLTRDGRIKILDFGLAKHDTNATVSITASLTTGPLIVTGTPAYMSPEQIAGRTVDQRSDLFSFGVIMYEMLAGRRPFAGETSISVMHAVLCEEPADLPEFAPTAVGRVLRHCLEKDPEQRMQSAADLSFALRMSTQHSSQTTAVAKAPRKKLPALTIALGVIALLASSGVIWLASRSSASPYSGSLRRLTWDLGLTEDGAISPDGKLIAYASDRANPSNLEIYVQQVDGAGIARITNDPGDDFSPTFSADSAFLAFRSERIPIGVYEASVLGGQARLIVPGGERPRFSPDGRYLMYSRGLNVTGSALFVQANAGGTPIEVTRGCPWVNQSAAWSPDSAHILFSGTCGGRTGLWLASPDGSPPVEAKGSADFWTSHNLISEGMPSVIDDWLANPSRLLVPLRDNDASFEASIRIDANGRLREPVQRLVFGPVRTSRASASENGRTVLSAYEQSSNIWKLNVNPAGRVIGPPVRITAGKSESVMPSVSRDGKMVAVATRQPGQWALEVTDLQTGEHSTVARDLDAVTYPIFSPDGENIIYSSSQHAKKVAIGGGLAETLPYNHVMDWSQADDVLAQPDDFHAVDIVQEKTRKVTRFLYDKDDLMYQAHFSADGKWVVFDSVKKERSRIYVVPFREGPVSKSEWIPITGVDFWDDKPHFSPDHQFIFFTSDRDGNRCLWAQPLTADMHPKGAPFALWHLHSSRRSLDGPTGGGLELAAGPGMVVFNQGERTGNIWLLESRKEH
jgi:eukaryotic-like serine/threonine-protein kinase